MTYVKPAMDVESTKCAVMAEALGVDPVGTAGSYSGLLLVEWPLPWPRTVAELAPLAPVIAAATERQITVRLVLPMTTATGTKGRYVVLFSGGDNEGGFRAFERREQRVEDAGVVDAALELLNGNLPTSKELIRDVLVCTHGKRDSCCGSLGTRLAISLNARYETRPDVRIWRSSHTGGHRFAPTVTVLPEAMVWARADLDAVHSLVLREGRLNDLLPNYRGCLAVGPSPVQAMERVAFGCTGWPWLDWSRHGIVDGNQVRLLAESPEGESKVWDGIVVKRREVPIPVCGVPLVNAKEFQEELSVEAYQMQSSAIRPLSRVR